MENKQNTLAAVLGAIVILFIFVVAAIFVGQKVKDNFSKPKTNVVTSVPDDTSSNLLNDNKKATVSGKYKTIPSTGPESLVLLFLPVVGAAGIYFRKFAS